MNRYILSLLCAGTFFSMQATRDTTTSARAGIQPEITKTHFKGEPSVKAIVMQPDGKILVAGRLDHYLLLMRYNKDLSLDTTFNTTGIVLSSLKNYNTALAVAVQPDGKIVVVGLLNISLGVIRYNKDGSLDTTFNGSGYSEIAALYPKDIAVQKDGKIVVAAGSFMEGAVDYAVARYNLDGSLDTSFNPQGKTPGIVVSSLGSMSAGSDSITIQKDGKLLVSGHVDNICTLVRYNLDGSLDTSFGGTGIVKTGVALAPAGSRVGIQKNGKILVAITCIESHQDSVFQKAMIVRYNLDGSLDKKFNSHGTQPGVAFIPWAGSVQLKELMIQKDGYSVVVGGCLENLHQGALARYKLNGTLDDTFNMSDTQPGVAITSFDDAIVQAATLDSCDKIVLAADNNYDSEAGFVMVARYNGDAA